MLGNPEVVSLLEHWLEEAKKGELDSAVFAAHMPGHRVAYDYAGVRGVENELQEALKVLNHDLDALQDSRRFNKRKPELDASFVEYNIARGPMNWDFLVWLIDAEMTRRRLKARSPLRVAFSYGTGEDPLEVPHTKQYLENVFRPLLRIVGAVEDNDALGGRHKPVYVPCDVVVAYKAGEQLPSLTAPKEAKELIDQWLHGTKPIVITLREATSHNKNRNSNLEAWLKFAQELQDGGKDVIFVRDTAKANEPLPGFVTCPLAATNLWIRMALYERAELNMGVSNGPLGLCLFSEMPYLYFTNLGDTDDYHCNDPLWWYRSNGIHEGEQWPWALAWQKMVWARDSYENIHDAWVEYHKEKIDRAHGYDHLYTQQDKKEFTWLLDKIKGSKSLLEVGSCYGQSLKAFTEYLGKDALVRSIDIGGEADWWNSKDLVLNARVDELQDKGYNIDLLFEDSKSEKAVDWVKQWAPYDFIFIDGDHSYEGVKSDFDNYGPLGKIVGFHDIANPAELGVGKLWNEIKSKYKTDEITNLTTNTMGIGIAYME